MRIVRYSYPAYRNPTSFRNGFGSPAWAGLENEISRLLENTLADLAAPTFPVSVYEDAANVYVRAELPGVNRADMSIELLESHLDIGATRKVPAKDEEQSAEQTISFRRSIDLPSEVQPDQVTAVYENGILTVTLAKREEAKPKKIAVTVS